MPGDQVKRLYSGSISSTTTVYAAPTGTYTTIVSISFYANSSSTFFANAPAVRIGSIQITPSGGSTYLVADFLCGPNNSSSSGLTIPNVDTISQFIVLNPGDALSIVNNVGGSVAVNVFGVESS